MKRLEYNTIKINSEETFDMDVLARDASLRNSSRFIFRFAQAGLFIASNILLHRRVADRPLLSSLDWRPASILKGDEHGTRTFSRGPAMLFVRSDCVCRLSGNTPDVPRSAQIIPGASMPVIDSIDSITDKLPKQMSIVKKNLCGV